MKTVVVSHRYDHPADEVWASIVSYPALQELASGDVNFASLPQRQARAGDEFTFPMRVFGLPMASYKVRVLERDDHQRRLQSHEFGGPIKNWEHTVEVTPEGSAHCVVTDRVLIDAGALSGFVAGKAKRMYRERARRRALLLARSAVAPGATTA
ncbi:MAG: SRPBCC family protein [Parvularcula sp.]|jgi:ligand-binding SRPBCC domain-containing protein|nr:SRPBCC family protein [Parvularcula sp.]